MELLDVLNENGEFTGETMDRKKIHDLGIWHRCVHIWIINSKGELLIQQRAKHLDNFGGLWDISAAGHVTSGETNEEAALKEVREELGLGIPFSEYIFLAELKVSLPNNKTNGVKNHFDVVYLIKKDLNVEELVLQEDEVEKVEFVHWCELKNRIAQETDNFANRSQEYEMLFNYLEKQEML
jgi:isopentenyldiphosphate isomerase